MNCQEIITSVFNQLSKEENMGIVAQYIPELSKVSSEKFGVALSQIDGEIFEAGDAQEKFSIQSIAKVLSLSLAYKKIGDDIWDRVDVEPSGNPFNSLVQLEYENGIPRNPLINAGAIVICDILVSELSNPQQELIEFVRSISQNESIDYNLDIYQSEKDTGYRNFALVNYLKSLGNIKNDVDEVLDFYFRLCSIEMTCTELAQTFLFLANNGKSCCSEDQIITPKSSKRINAIMQTSGFYDEAGEFAYRVGLPGKSGVGGGIVAILPGEYAIAVWSPKLNPKGNSYRGMKFLEEFTTKTGGSIF